jgi:hypothetical chaperone protein
VRAVGVDFGTTNSSVAWLGDDGRPVLAEFGEAGPTFRSVLYFDRNEGDRGRVEWRAGPFAIQRYLAAEEKNGRLIQSLKSFLASRLFRATQIFGQTWRLESLAALILRSLREEAERALGEPIARAVVGRPVRFVNARDAADEKLALARLRAALHNAGFLEIEFELEPVGAAYHYETRLDSDELILIADFGGGTSDFSLLRVGPSRRTGPAGAGRERGILANGGVPVAGDAFDGKLIRHLVAPALGKDSEFRSQLGGQILRTPAWIWKHLERWHHLSFLKSPRTLQTLLDLRREALDREKLEALLHVVENDLGFLLFQAVEAAKRALSTEPEAVFRFAHEGLSIEALVTRAAFEGWIAEELGEIADCVDGVVAQAGLRASDVERVFLTGGSSFVPAVRRLFEERFGAEGLRFGGELTSVANGLALRAGEAPRGL